MFTVDRYIHFVLDYENDIHYTDTLLALSPEAYVWYELRKQHIDNALFITETGSGIQLGAYDSDSAALLKPEKKKFGWGKSQSEQELKPGYKAYSLQEVGEDHATALAWLLERPEQGSQKSRVTALVFTLDAFVTLYKSARDKDRQKLSKLAARPTGRSILIIRINMNIREMTNAFLREDSILTQLCPSARQVLEGTREPLLDGLSRQLDRQLVHAWRITQEDVHHVLLHTAMAQGDWTDDAQELKDQAICLHGRHLSQSEACRRKDLYESLLKPEQRQQARLMTTRLRQEYPQLSMADAVMIETVEGCGFGPSPLEYDSPLAKNVRAIVLPEDFLKEADNYRFQAELLGIKENFRTVWNRPLNRAVVQNAEFFCNEVRQAIKRQDWDTLRDGLELLRFCGEELCAEESDEKSLQTIFEGGKTVINLSYNHYLRQSAQAAFGSGQGPGGVYARKWDQVRQIQEDAAKATGDAEDVQLHVLRTTIRRAMSDFKKRQISQAAVEQIFQDAQKRLAEELDRAALQPVIPEPEPIPAEEPEDEDFEFEEIAFGDEQEILQPLPPQPPVSRRYTQEDKDADRQACEDLLRRNDFFLG